MGALPPVKGGLPCRAPLRGAYTTIRAEDRALFVGHSAAHSIVAVYRHAMHFFATLCLSLPYPTRKASGMYKSLSVCGAVHTPQKSVGRESECWQR